MNYHFKRTKGHKMDTQTLAILITIGAFFVVLLGTILTLFLWNRSESQSDTRRTLDLIEAIKNEMKDFHGRLCAIEERSVQNKLKR